MAPVAFSDYLAGGCIQGGKQGGGAVTFVVMGVAFGLPGLMGRSSAWIWDFSSTQKTAACPTYRFRKIATYFFLAASTDDSG
jgi:hypothetical protein